MGLDAATEDIQEETNDEKPEDTVMTSWTSVLTTGELTDDQLRELAAIKELTTVCNAAELYGLLTMPERRMTPEPICWELKNSC